MGLKHLLWKDLRVELRGKEGLQAGLVLIALFLLVDLFLFESLATRPAAAAAVLWFPLIFAVVAALGRGLARDVDHGTLDLMRLAPVDTAWHGVSRTLVNLLMAWALLAATLLLASLIFAVPITAPLVVLLALCAVGLALPTTLASGLAAQTRAREVLLPILVVPVVAPLVQAGIRGSLILLEGGSWVDAQIPFLLVGGYTLLAAGVAWMLWPHALEDA